ncbi:ABC transporter ATP-binding protein [Candidatus Bathyarchaeota archaeon]|nr:MAG: ABC transporter ATP-binding protein [Candidatus Bathyarchaeota archaeon]
MTEHPLLEVKGLKVYYRTPIGTVKAVDDVEFTVKRNEIFGIAGESGCGKSTLATALLRLNKPPCYIVSGKILFDGVNLLDLDEEELRRVRWKDLSIIPQASMNALNPCMRIGDQIIDAITAHENTTKEEAKERVRDLLRSVGLSEDVARMYPHELSGGMKQRAIIAMSIALKPKLLIADEPTTALDVNVQRVVLQTLVDVKQMMGASLMIITHNMAVLAEVVDRLAIMYAGKIVEIGDVYDLFKDPLHPYSKGLISALPSIEKKKRIRGIPGYPPNLLDPPTGCRFYPRCPLRKKLKKSDKDKCKLEEPTLREVEPGRLVACHFAHAGA